MAPARSPCEAMLLACASSRSMLCRPWPLSQQALELPPFEPHCPATTAIGEAWRRQSDGRPAGLRGRT